MLLWNVVDRILEAGHHQRLSGEVEQDLGLRLAQMAGEQLARAHVGDAAVDAAWQPTGREQRRVGGGRQPDPVTSAPELGEPGGEPGALEPGVPGDHHAPIRPRTSGWPCCYLLIGPSVSSTWTRFGED